VNVFFNLRIMAWGFIRIIARGIFSKIWITIEYIYIYIFVYLIHLNPLVFISPPSPCPHILGLYYDYCTPATPMRIIIIVLD